FLATSSKVLSAVTIVTVMAYLLEFNKIPELQKVVPASSLVYSMLHNCYKNNNKWPILDIFIDDLDIKKITSVVCHEYSYNEEKGIYFYFLYSTNPANLKQLLQQTGVVEWNARIIKSAGDTLSFEVMKQLCREHGLLNKEPTYFCHQYILTDQDRLKNFITKMVLPEKFKIAPLQMDHAKLLHSKWMYAEPPPLQRFENLIKYQPTLAIYNEKQQPISWGAIKEFGDIGFTQTLPEYQRQSLASIVTANLARQSLQNGVQLCVVISDSNEASK
uniref:Glycine N-acyltransferase-like protein n=1 Tax=Saccoglossus kowalevskii TaxID=10224 RepID=A0ABM0MZM8_SACKO